MKTMFKGFAVCALASLLLAGCASLQPQVAVGNEKKVELKAESFKFSPNNIRAFDGDTVLFSIENSSSSAHNFTITDPQKQVLKSVSLPAGKTTDISISFSGRGTYEFYCDKPLHSSFGMKGQVEVVKK